MVEVQNLAPLFGNIWGVFGFTAWFIVIFLLALVISQYWLTRIRLKHLKGIKWLLLEFEVPRENLRSVKSMEQVFASLHATYSFGLDFWEKWWEGKLEPWLCLEMTGSSEGVRFFIRTPESFRNLVETAFFSQYPDVEIHEAQEYTDEFGKDLPNENIDLFGFDLILSKNRSYPVRTYPSFEEQVEERRVDPMATIAEVISNLKGNERAWLQLLIRPTGSDWKKEADDIINDLTGRGKKDAKKSMFLGFINGIFHFIHNLIAGALRPPEWPESVKAQERPVSEPPKRFTPGEIDALKAIENKVSKVAFESIIRFIYFDDKSDFTTSNVTAIRGAFRQFDTLNLNSFRVDLETLTGAYFLFRFFRTKSRVLQRKKNLFFNYTHHLFPPFFQFPLGSSGGIKVPILNIEELATVFHPPITAVEAPKLFRLEAKKGEPPANLPLGE